MRRKRTWRYLLLGCALILFLAARVYEPGDEASHDHSSGHSTLSYALTWADGADQVETDLGYTVTVTAGVLTNASLSLIPCADSVASVWPWLTPATVLPVMAMRATCHAGWGR